MPERPSLPRTIDQWVATIAAMLPIALNLGSVAFELVIGLTGLLWLFRMFTTKARSFRRLGTLPVFLPLVFWMIGILLSRITNGFSAFEFFHDFALLRYMIFFLAIVDVSGRLPMDSFLESGAIAGILWMALNFSTAMVIGVDWKGDSLSKYVGKLHEGQRIAAFCAYIFPFLAVRFVAGKDLQKLKRISLLGISIVSGLLLFAMEIRTAWLAAAIGLVGGLIVTLKGRLRWGIAAITAFLLAGCGYVMYTTGYQTSMKSMYDRFWIWRDSLVLWKENPVFGVGVATFSKAIHRLAEINHFKPYVAPNGVEFQVGTASHSHNLILYLLSSTGMWGLLSFLWLAIAAVRSCLRDSSGRSTGLMAFPFAMGGIAFTGWSIYDSFYASIVMFCLAWMSCQRPTATDLHGKSQ